MQFTFVPLQEKPIIYTSEQIKDIEPQLNQLIENCTSLIQKVDSLIKNTDNQQSTSECALEALQGSLQLEDQISELKYNIREKQKGKQQHIQFKRGHSTILGKRPSNEDAHVVTELKNQDRQFTIAAVFDGHAGQGASQYCSKNFIEKLEKNKSFPKNIKRSLKDTFIEMDCDYCSYEGTCGCTATAVVVDNKYPEYIFTANAGDARIIASFNNKVIRLTRDHKPSEESEKARIEAKGSFVATIFGVARVAGQLAVSRAIGDADYKQFGVTACPETKAYGDDEEDEKGNKIEYDENRKLDYILLACDGLYDVLKDEEVNAAMQTALGEKPIIQNQTDLDEKRIDAIQKAMQHYLRKGGNTEDGDKELQNFTAPGISNDTSKCDDPQQMQGPDKIAAAMTRIAYMLGSMDNITCIVLIPEKNYEKYMKAYNQ